MENEETPELNIIDTSSNAHDGQNKCPKCGATDISLKIANGKLRCNFCRFEFDAAQLEDIEEVLDNLDGLTIGSGAQDIEEESEDIITLKCESCGADVIISTAESLQARCHWCRNTLSINNKIPNGAVPDIVLPFALSKEEARKHVEEFIKDRWFFADKRFRDEFTTENIFGVYLPYMVVDLKASASLQGEGEVQTRSYTITINKVQKRFYDADAYIVNRDFDININDLTIESSQDKLDYKSSADTKNVINAILPFDTENAVKWNANYLKGFHSEKRDTNIAQLQAIVRQQAADIARVQAQDSIQQYDRGVRWEHENIQVHGQQWLSAYLPVWIYSYQKQAKGKLYYTAVNARTKETMGSIPLNYMRLSLVSLIIFFLSLSPILSSGGENEILYLLLTIGPIYFYWIYSRYTNQGERHRHELETESEMKNMQASDHFYEHRKRLSSDEIKNCNSKTQGNSLFDFKVKTW